MNAVLFVCRLAENELFGKLGSKVVQERQSAWRERESERDVI
jgi:hypothetical protein